MTDRVLPGPAVVLDGVACARLDGLLIRALRDAQVRDAAVPASVLEIAADVHWAAVKFKDAALVEGGSRTQGTGIDNTLPAWDLEGLNTRKAARLAGVSSSYLCRAIRRGDVSARLVRGGGYEIDAASLATWLSRRDQPKAASDGEQSERRAVRTVS